VIAGINPNAASCQNRDLAPRLTSCRRRPLPVADGRVQRGAAIDRRTGMLDIRSGIEQRVYKLHVIVASRPMQRCLAMPHPDGRRIEIVASRGEHQHDHGSIRMVSRPIG
jgi:hypothetical protein